MTNEKIKVVGFNSLPFEERQKLTYYIELQRMRGMEQVRHLLKDDIGKNQQKKILEWEQAISDSLEKEYEVTDNEIIKALECCGNIVDSSCKECAFHETYNASCVVKLMRNTLDLINRKDAEIIARTEEYNDMLEQRNRCEAEIKRLQEHNKEYGFCNLLGNVLVYSKNLKDYNDMRKGLKSEAIKEFAKWIDVNERLPKTGERVLVVCTNSQNHMQTHISICEFWGERHQVCGEIVHKPLWSGHKDVTHWQPLPELPKVGD